VQSISGSADNASAGDGMPCPRRTGGAATSTGGYLHIDRPHDPPPLRNQREASVRGRFAPKQKTHLCRRFRPSRRGAQRGIVWLPRIEAAFEPGFQMAWAISTSSSCP
jgi:hypothetical protein